MFNSAIHFFDCGFWGGSFLHHPYGFHSIHIDNPMDCDYQSCCCHPLFIQQPLDSHPIHFRRSPVFSLVRSFQQIPDLDDSPSSQFPIGINGMESVPSTRSLFSDLSSIPLDDDKPESIYMPINYDNTIPTARDFFKSLKKIDIDDTKSEEPFKISINYDDSLDYGMFGGEPIDNTRKSTNKPAKAATGNAPAQTGQQNGSPVDYNPNGTAEDDMTYIQACLGGTPTAAPAKTTSAPEEDFQADEPEEHEFARTTDFTGADNTPEWYKDLAIKVSDGDNLTPQEQALFDNFEKMLRNYYPFTGEKDARGKYKLNKFGQEIADNLIDQQKIDTIKKYLNECSPEKLAAIEFFFNEISQNYGEVTEAKSLRATIKDKALGLTRSWSNYPLPDVDRVFDKLDTGAELNPRSLARALYQALENHYIAGISFDENRTIKLLKVAAKNPVFLDALKQEFKAISGRSLSTILDKKMNKSSALESLMDKLKI